MLITNLPGTDYLRWKLSLFEIIILAAALGIDCLVVSFSQGLIFSANRIKNSLILAVTMGIFQGIMPCIGYLGTETVSRYLESFSKWLVFIIFLSLGIKFIYEAFQEKTVCCLNLKCLILMGIATSIDALVSGISLNLTGTHLYISALIIGLMSFVMSLSGFWLGIFFKKLPSKVLEICGGLVLIFLALKSAII